MEFLQHVLTILIHIGLFGLLVWAVLSLIPMPDKFKQIIQVVAVVAAVVYALKALQIFPA